MKPDFVSELVALAGEVAGVDASAAARLDAELRGRFGGKQVRIAERPPLTVERIDAELRQRKPVRQVAADLGVSRATIYRYLGKPKKSRAPA